jgi:hypothetical protein
MSLPETSAPFNHTRAKSSNLFGLFVVDKRNYNIDQRSML